MEEVVLEKKGLIGLEIESSSSLFKNWGWWEDNQPPSASFYAGWSCLEPKDIGPKFWDSYFVQNGQQVR